MREIAGTPEKRAKTESEVPSTPKPLTRENLALLEGKMPPKSDTVSGASKTPTIKTSSTDYEKQEDILRNNGIEMPNREFEKTEIGKSIVAKARELIVSERLSTMKDDHLKKFMAKREEEKYSNEASFVYIIWKIMVGDTRQVKEAGENVLEEHEGVFIKEWEEDGLRFRVDQAFRPKCIQMTDAKAGASLEKLLEKLPGVKTPKPDLAYGLRKDAFTSAEQNINMMIAHIADLSRNMLYPFYNLEFKSDQGAFHAAILQACRGGAALIYAMRNLRERAGLVNNNDEDDVGRMAFSLVIVPERANLYVHWAMNVTEPKVVYHMAKLSGYDLENDDDVPKLRIAINNILEWGIIPRKNYIKHMLAKIGGLPGSEATSKESNQGQESGQVVGSGVLEDGG